MSNLILNNGTEIPDIGFGTWQTTENVQKTVKLALEAGYRHIDTAAIYGNEAEIGEALADSKIPRKDLYLTTKIWNSNRSTLGIKTSVEQSLKKLQTNYLDLLLIHWPANEKQFANWKEINAETWKAMEELYKTGVVKSIGVSNFMLPHIKALLESAEIIPAVNQIEFHPGYTQPKVVDYCKEKGIAIEAWSPIGSGRLLKDRDLKAIADQYNVSPAILCIQFCLQCGVVVLPKSENKENINNNLHFNRFEISESDMEKLKTLKETGFSGLNPETVDF
ncbi:Aldo/keto reductase [Epilithonimonas bovis DSM 19482]|uniref:Aldo/keto reductase n=1 Tax=Epilithonimonas bovis DSM 19482 TaxID=1121284 RepID=A0A1U7PSV0_9FLAO|nr:aldo/keto reductase [Epilithonimonas bovis]SIT95604.1 Aldo/keto reductase [Epilithonimonas bovis DSM 19482]